MREILFRGYNKETKKWYYGFLGKRGNRYTIDNGNNTVACVEKDSIGQYTGFEDNDGNKIFEGDILDAGFGIILIVKFQDGYWGAICEEKGDYFSHSLYSESHSSNCKVVGNVYEEQLKLKEDK